MIATMTPTINLGVLTLYCVFIITASLKFRVHGALLSLIFNECGGATHSGIG